MTLRPESYPRLELVTVAVNKSLRNDIRPVDALATAEDMYNP